MFAPNASASGPPGAKRGGGSPPVTGVSRAVVAGDAQATTHTSSTSAHTRARATSFSSPWPPARWLVGGLRARWLAIACLPYPLPAVRCVARHGVGSHPVPVARVESSTLWSFTEARLHPSQPRVPPRQCFLSYVNLVSRS